MQDETCLFIGSRNSSVTSLKNLINTKKTWDGNLMKKPRLLLSEAFQQHLNELGNISVVVLLYDEMRLLKKHTGNNSIE